MAAALPFITTAITAATAAVSYTRGKRADQASRKAAAAAKTREKAAAALRKQASDKQNRAEFQQRKELGARRRIMSLRQGGQGGSLFSGFGGVQKTLGG